MSFNRINNTPEQQLPNDNQFGLTQNQIEEQRSEFVSKGGVVSELPAIQSVKDGSQYFVPFVDEKTSGFVVWQAIAGAWYCYGRITKQNPHAEGGLEQYNTGATVVVSAMNTLYEVTAGWTTYHLDGVKTDDNGRFIIQNAGDYKIVWHLSVYLSTANQAVEGGILVNGKNLQRAYAHCYQQTANTKTNMGSNGVFELDKGDAISIGVANTTSTEDIVIEHASFSIVRIR